MKITMQRFEEWLINKNLKERTIEEYMYYFSKFQDNLFNQETASKFLAVKSNRNGVARSFLINLRKFITQNYKELGFSVEQRLEASEVELPQVTGRKKKRLINYLTREQVFEIGKHLEGEKYKLMLLCSYYGGLRVGELLKIKVVSFNWGEWKKDTSKPGECKVFGKGDKEGLAYFPSSLMVKIARYIKANKKFHIGSTIFIRDYSSYKNIKSGTTTWESKLKQAGIKAGITKVDGEGKVIEGTNVHPHLLRHSFHEELRRKGVDISVRKELMRHSRISSTEVYSHLDKEELKEEIAKVF